MSAGGERLAIRIGCSGWNYAHWRNGVFYPPRLPSRRWLDFYAQHFDTVEVNNTFYRLPPPSTVEGWAAQAPPGFRYALKLGQFGSHRMKLKDAASWLPNHLDRVERLGKAAGPTLVQLPPRWRRNPERLDEFLAVAPKRYRWAVELREGSWLHEEVYEVLRRHRAALCIHDLLADHPWELTTDWTYIRFHGAGPDGDYSPELLDLWAERIGGFLAGGADAWVYFNNDWHGFAPRNAQTLQRLLGVTSRTTRPAEPARQGG